MNKFRKNTLIFAVLILFVEINYAQQVYFDGVYSGKKVIVNNPLSLDYFGTCVNRIRVNGELFPINISENYLEIDLNRVGVQKGDLFTILIEHETGCEPFIYNKNDFLAKNIVIFKNLKIQDNQLSWETKNNVLLSPIILEMKYKGKWVEIAMITSKGLGNQAYTYQLPFVLSGENNFRISKPNAKNSYSYFPSIQLPNQHFSIASPSVTKTVHFIQDKRKATTYYQLLDKHKVIVKQGFGEQIDISNVKEGIYTLYYDNQKEIIIKK